MNVSRRAANWIAGMRRARGGEGVRPLPIRSTRLRSRGVARAREFWRTWRVLVMHPGRLTTLHRRGIRARFVSPGALYLLFGLLFLSVLKFLADGPRVRLDLVDFNVIIRPPALACAPDAPQACGWTDHLVAAFGRRWEDAATSARFARRLLDVAPYVAFVALPFLATIVARFHRDRRRRFADHLVFATHLQAFWFLVATAAFFLHGGLAFAAWLSAPAYALCSLHEVYGGRWYCTAGRALAIASSYLVVLIALSATIVSLWR